MIMQMQQTLSHFYHQISEIRMQWQFNLESFSRQRNMVSPEKLENSIRQKSTWEKSVYTHMHSSEKYLPYNNKLALCMHSSDMTNVKLRRRFKQSYQTKVHISNVQASSAR